MGFTARDARGFSLVELMLTVAVLGTLIAVGVPVMQDLTESIKLNDATRTVERELQSARLRAVSVNRVLRVRLNCPGAGYLRTVELTGTAAIDDAVDRCLTTRYPFPAPDTDLMTRPNFDGPVRVLPQDAAVSTAVVQFSPDGTAATVVSGAVTALAAPLNVTVTRHGKTRTITVNNAGKVQLQQ